MSGDFARLWPGDRVVVGLSVAALVVGICVSLLGEARVDPPEADGPVDAWARHSLEPVANPDPGAGERIPRARPQRVVASADGAWAWVTLSGTESRPGSSLVLVDVRSHVERGRIEVGHSPQGMALHPSGRWLVVTNRFSNFMSVIDTATDRVTSEIPVPFYCEDLVFGIDGERLFVTNSWHNQVLVVELDQRGETLAGSVVTLGFDREAFLGPTEPTSADGKTPARRTSAGLRSILRARCGTSGCHQYRAGGFVAGPDAEEALSSAIVHVFPGEPEASSLIRIGLSVADGGTADAADGRHHAGGVVFDDPEDPDLQRLRAWIAAGTEGPGISVGHGPRDLALSPDGGTLYVANTGTLDVSVIDVATLEETRRIFTRSPVNDIAAVDDWLVFATLGVGSGHPKEHDPGRESTDRDHPETEFTMFRDPDTGRVLPLAQQEPLGPYEAVDGTAQEKFRDISNDIVVLDPSVDSVAAYVSNPDFTRYTSDTFEAMAGDIKGDVAPELMQVVGAFPEQIERSGEHLYVTMSGTSQVQQWRVAGPQHLTPGLVFDTGLKPVGLAVAGDELVVADQLGDTLSFVDLETGERDELVLEPDAPRFPADDFERGELFVQTSLFSVDRDQSCVHCHYRDTSDGQAWSVSQVMGQSRGGAERTGGSRAVPDIRNLFQEVPFFQEGVLSIDEPLTMMMEHNPLVDFQGDTPVGDFSAMFAPAEERESFSHSADTLVTAGTRLDSEVADLVYRREVFFQRTSEEVFGQPWGFRDLQRFIGVYQGAEPRLLPNPVSPDDPMVAQGRQLFESPTTGCSGCHPAPTFTDKVHVHNDNKAFPPLVTPAARDNVHSLVSADRIDWINGFSRYWDTGDEGRVEAHEGHFVAPSLRGLWSRPPRFLHHGGALSLREVVATPDHPALRPGETGLNEHDGLIDTHGTTSQLSIWELECLVRYLRSIE